MNSGESAIPTIDKLALAAIQNRRELRARRERVGLGEILVDDDLVGSPGLGHSAEPHMKPIERGFADFGQRNELSGRRLAKVRNVEQRQSG